MKLCLSSLLKKIVSSNREKNIPQSSRHFHTIRFQSSCPQRKALLQAFEELESLLAKNEICIAVKEKLVKDSGVAEESGYDAIVQRLLTKRRARGTYIKSRCGL